MQINKKFADVAIIDKSDLQELYNEIAQLKDRLDELGSLSMPKKEILTLKDVAEITSYKVSYLRQLVFRDEIPSVRLGRSIRFNRKDVEQWLEEKSSNRIETEVSNHIINNR
jgi:excisionase family DNA binding protein